MKFYSLNQIPLYTDDFSLRFFDDVHSRDAIVIFHPMESMIITPVLIRSRKSLEEHIKYIHDNNIRKAIIVADDIHFLKRCPSLEYLMIFPSIDAKYFDYSPLYEMPSIKWLQCETMYGLKTLYDVNEKVKVANIDYSRINGIKKLLVNGGKGHKNVHMAKEVETLNFGDFPKSDTLSGVIPGEKLKNFSLCQVSIRSLEGIQAATGLRRLELLHNRRLTDISALRYLRDSLVYLEIDTCGKIMDFSILSELYNLEFLILKGNNTLSNLSFLEKLPKLKNLHLTMNVEDGDLSPCMKIPYVRIKNRKHYSHKDAEMPKDYTVSEKEYSLGVI